MLFSQVKLINMRRFASYSKHAKVTKQILIIIKPCLESSHQTSSPTIWLALWKLHYYWMTATGKCYPYPRVIVETRVNFTPCKGNNLTTWHMWARRAPWVATIHDDYQRVKPGPPYPSARLQRVCLGGHTVGGPCTIPSIIHEVW
jgi:hypothetical protein